ncbi:MAG: hypothetical protein ACI9EW_000508 [Cellvibrionaceae bacterium]|jgi:hypothetical protein
MNKNLSNLIQFSSKRTISLLEGLTAEEWFIQPDGFANNIAWNVGHMLLVRHNLIYRNSGLETGLDEAMTPMYNGGTSPADWESQPDSAALLDLLKSMSEKLAADVESGLFDDTVFKSFELAGTPIESVNDSAGFDLFHEGLHLGHINDLRDVIRSG